MVGVPELAPNPIATVALAPVAVASSLAQLLVDREVDELMLAVSESTLLAVVAVSKFGVGLAKLGLVLERVGSNAGYSPVNLVLLRAIAFGASVL